MARRRPPTVDSNIQDFRHGAARRRNNPPSGIAPTYEVRERRTTSYAYDPHLDPQLQWAGKAEQHAAVKIDMNPLSTRARLCMRVI